jgi:hypothetical protein
MTRPAVVTAALLLFIGAPAIAGDYVLPVFALRIPGKDGSTWTSEVYVSNSAPQRVIVHEGTILPGRITGTPPCLPVVPTLDVPPRTTLLWQPSTLALGLGCPEFALGGLGFSSDGEVVISSRMVNVPAGDKGAPAPLHGLGQEIPAYSLLDLPRAGTPMILPGVAWQPNACGPPEFETNLFLTNPGDVTLDVAPESPKTLLVDGTEVSTPLEIVVAPRAMRQFRVSAPNSPLAVCLPPVVSSLSFRADGPIAVIASVVDRASGDPRTVLPIAARE